MSIPYSVFIEVTNACNSNCLHCRGRTGKCLPNELNTAELIGIIDRLYSMGTPYLVLTGGEPLLRDDIYKVVRYSCSLGMKTLLATNGFLLTPDRIGMLATLKNLSIQISLDGASPQMHDSFRGLDGSFESAIRALNICTKEGTNVSVSMTVTRYNIGDLPRVIDLARELGVPTIKIRRFIPNGQGFENISLLDLSQKDTRALIEFYIERKWALRQEIDLQMEQAPCAILVVKGRPLENEQSERVRGGCSAGNAICVIDPIGNVRPCPSLPINVGNIREHDFESIWDSSYILNQLRDRSKLLGSCGECGYKYICGGCRAAAFAEYGDYLADDPKCWYSESLKCKEVDFAETLANPQVVVAGV